MKFFDFVLANPNKDWEFGLLSSNPNITWSHVIKNPKIKWNYFYLSENPNITIDVES